MATNENGFRPLPKGGGKKSFPQQEGDERTGIPAGERTITLDDGSSFKKLLLKLEDGTIEECADHHQVREAFELYPDSILHLVYKGKVRIKAGRTVADYDIGEKPAA